jgi:O-antigen/teichoic acid export membrane protein
MLRVTLAEVAGRMLLIAGTALAAYARLPISWIFAFISLASLLNVLLVYFSARPFVRLKPAFDWSIWREMLKKTWPMALSISFNLIYLKMDIIILSLVRSQAEVGQYGAAYRIVDILTMLPAVYMGIVLPHLTRFFKHGEKKEFDNLLQHSFDSLMIFAIPVVLGTLIVAERFMTFAVGSEFFASGNILRILIFASAAIFGTSFWGYLIVAIEKQRQIMWAYLTTAVLTLGGYLIFIPRYGFWGAAAMTVFSEVLVLVWSWRVARKTIAFKPKYAIFGKSLLASLLMAMFLILTNGWPILLALFGAIVIYFSTMFILGGLKKEMVADLSARG